MCVKRVLKSPGLSPACDHFQLANCRVACSSLSCMLLAYLRWLGPALWREMYLKAVFSAVVERQQVRPPGPCVTGLTSLWRRLKILHTPPLSGFASLTLCIYKNDKLTSNTYFSLFPLFAKDQLALDWNKRRTLKMFDLFFTQTFTWPLPHQSVESHSLLAFPGVCLWIDNRNNKGPVFTRWAKMSQTTSESNIGHAEAQSCYIWLLQHLILSLLTRSASN